jgi:hypothetical protein
VAEKGPGGYGAAATPYGSAVKTPGGAYASGAYGGAYHGGSYYGGSSSVNVNRNWNAYYGPGWGGAAAGAAIGAAAGAAAASSSSPVLVQCFIGSEPGLCP